MWKLRFRDLLLLVVLVQLGCTLDPTNQLASRPKRDIEDRFQDDYCIHHFSIDSRTIIRTKDSRENGAVFINETEVESMTRCLQLCCTTPLCNVAVYGEENSCYLFDCGSPTEFKCQFTANDQFASALLDIDRHKFDLTSVSIQRGHSEQLSSLRSREENNKVISQPDEEPPLVQDDCGRWEFSCNSGDCIAIYDVCNGIPQCRDGSDEDPEFCRDQTTPTPPTQQPTQHPHYRPDADPPPPAPEQNSVFQHRGGLQVYGGHLQDQGYQQQPGYNQPQASLNYPQVPNSPMNLQAQNNFQYIGSPYMQQFQQQYTSQFAPQYGMQSPILQPAQQQQQLNARQQQQQQQHGQLPMQVQAQVPQQQPSTTARPTTAKKIRTTTKATTTTVSEMDKLESKLIEEMEGELQPLQMPGLAMFTLVVGVALTTFIITVVICRIRRGRINFRRKLTHDADGDFLVNGMYL